MSKNLNPKGSRNEIQNQSENENQSENRSSETNTNMKPPLPPLIIVRSLIDYQLTLEDFVGSGSLVVAKRVMSFKSPVSLGTSGGTCLRGERLNAVRSRKVTVTVT